MRRAISWKQQEQNANAAASGARGALSAQQRHADAATAYVEASCGTRRAFEFSGFSRRAGGPFPSHARAAARRDMILMRRGGVRGGRAKRAGRLLEDEYTIVIIVGVRRAAIKCHPAPLSYARDSLES